MRAAQRIREQRERDRPPFWRLALAFVFILGGIMCATAFYVLQYIWPGWALVWCVPAIILLWIGAQISGVKPRKPARQAKSARPSRLLSDRLPS